nr:7TM diverse intracellular signaling domain-containing protein [uncultured Draconibacterium sp.]
MIISRTYILGVCILVLNFCGFRVHANNKVSDSSMEPLYTIDFFTPDSTQNFTPENLRNTIFSRYNADELIPETYYWFKVVFDNRTLNECYYFIHFNEFFYKISGIYFNKNIGSWMESRGGSGIAQIYRTNHGFFKDKILFQKSEDSTTIVYINGKFRAESKRKLPNLQLLKKRDFDSLKIRTDIIQSFFAGIITVLCLLNLVLFVFSREKLHLCYFIYALVASLYFFFYYDYIEQFWFPANPEINKLFFFTNTVGQVLYFFFLYYAVNSKNVGKFRGWIYSYATAIGLITLAVTIFATIDFDLAVGISDYMSVLNGLLIILFFIFFINKVSNTVKIILFGSLFLSVGGAIAIIANFFSVSITHVYIYQVGFCIELILFTLAINFIQYNERIERVKKELEVARLQTERLTSEKELEELNRAIGKQNRELTYKAIVISQKESMQKNMIKQLSNLTKQNKIEKQNLHELILTLKANTNNRQWIEFENHFTSIHPLFYSSLHERYPNLTASEYKLCSFLKMNLSSKEIALITGKSQQSVDIARCRLRKKVGLKNHENISSIIAGLKSN